MRRREVLKSLGAPLAMGAGACSRAKGARPNLLLVVADDQSWADAGAYGAKHVKTPAFDRLAGEGVRFTNSFCASPSCTPSRSAILSGRHVWQQGEAGVLYGAMPPQMPLYPQLLEDAGYVTGFTGKGWGPGDWKALGAVRHPVGREYNTVRYLDPVRPGINPFDYAANFHQFLSSRPKDKPFCFWLGSAEPHRLYEAGSGLRAGKKLADARVPAFLPDTEQVRSDLLDYYLEIEWYDTQLMRALDVLGNTGELDQTLIVVTSDNGMPFPRAKANLYDWGTRMPLAMRWGDVVKGGRVADELVSHVDLAPTFLDAAGLAPPPGMAGRSLLPILQGQADASRDRVFTAMERHTMCRPDGATYPMRALRTKDYLYIRNFAPDRWPTGGEYLSSNRTVHGDIDAGPAKDAVLDGEVAKRFPEQVKLCLERRPGEELYGVAKDPGQIRNLAGDAAKAGQLAELRRSLEDYLQKTGDPRMEGKDPWQSFVYRQTTGYGASFNLSLPEAVREEARGKPTHKPE